ncbi:MAG: histone deacetylase family protein [Alphaproteobacteria bacterium]|nr:histone deacetylase family protein [Alphaproteobacteria bacterium]
METFYSEHQGLHAPAGELFGGLEVTPFDSPARADLVLEAVRGLGLGAARVADDFGEEAILRVHSADYVEFLKTIWDEWRASGREGDVQPTIWQSRSMPGRMAAPRDPDGRAGYYALAGETRITSGSWKAAYWSAQAALSGVRALEGGARSAFGLCRPPGHHAARDQFGGYCFLNNAAVAADALRATGVERAAILDIDFHHGNGTQQIFYERGDVYYVSLHGDPEETFPNFLGYADETGRGDGEGFNLNFPYPPGTGWDSWRDGLREACRVIGEYAPGALVVSLGVDTFHNDPTSFFELRSENYLEVGRMLARLRLPTLFLLEGGYDLEALGLNVGNVLRSFAEESRAG